MTPTHIGRYKITRELGRGGMAIVYLAQDPEVDRQVAIKVLPRQFTFEENFRARFKREAKVIAALEHPCIVPVYDFGEHDEQPFIVMRYMQGGSLTEYAQKGRVPLDQIAEIITRLARALDDAHQQGLVHRDLKPANVLFDRWGSAYLADFGIVKMAESSVAFTGSGIIGTPAYMSPEQAAGEREIDGRSDVYALGIILYELLAGIQPYQATTPMGLVVAHITKPVPNILQAASNLPPACEQIIYQTMAKNPDERYQTAGELAQAVHQMVAGKTPMTGQVVSAQVVPKSASPTVVETESPAAPVTHQPPAGAPALPSHPKQPTLPIEVNYTIKRGVPRWLWTIGCTTLTLVAIVITVGAGLLIKANQVREASGGLPTMPIVAAAGTATSEAAIALTVESVLLTEATPLIDVTVPTEAIVPTEVIAPTDTVPPTETSMPTATPTATPMNLVLSGWVADSDGVSIDGIVFAILNGDDRLDVQSDASGLFEVTVPRAGVWTVSMVSVDCTSRIVDSNCTIRGYFLVNNSQFVEVPQTTEVKFTYEKATQTITGQVVDSAGHSVDNVRVWGVRSDGAEAWLSSEDLGQFALPASVGQWEVYAVMFNPYRESEHVVVVVTAGVAPTPVKVLVPS